MKKVAIITGAANGIGRRMTMNFIGAGYTVAAIDFDKEGLEKLAGRYEENELACFFGDIGEKEVLESFDRWFRERFDRVDALINNACKSRGGLKNCSYDDFNYVLRVGVTAQFYLTQLLTDMFAKGSSIVNISSTRAMMSQANTESYTATKGAVTALTHAMAVTLSGKARVNAISPGWIDTGAYQKEESYEPEYADGDTLQHPSGIVGEPSDISQLALYLCSDAAKFINGQNIAVDGGMTKLMIYHADHGWTYDPKTEE